MTIGLCMAAGFILGMLATGIMVRLAMPRKMIVVKQSRLGFDETVTAVEKAIPQHGWNFVGTTDMRDSLAQHGFDCSHPVKIIVSVHGPQKHSEKLSRTVQTTNTIIAKHDLVVNSLAP